MAAYGWCRMSNGGGPDVRTPGSVTAEGGVQGGGGRSRWVGLWLAVAVVLAVSGLGWLGVFGERGPDPSAQPPTLPSSTTTTVSGLAAGLGFAWDLAERAGIRCEEDDGLDSTLEVCEYRGDWVSVRVFPGGGREAVLEWAAAMVDQFDSDVLVGDGWGIEYLFSSGSEGRLEELQAALGEGEIVASRRSRIATVADQVPEVVMGGPPLVWQWVMDLDEDQGFTSVLAAESGLWAVAGDDQEPSVLWYSADGLVWRGLDTAALFGDGAVVSMLVEGGPGLVAVGFRPAGGSGEAVAWTSTDGRDWMVSPLGYTIPEPEGPFEVTGLDFEQVAAGPSGAIIAASVWKGFDHDELERNVQAALPEGLREYRIMIEPWKISVSVGPFRVFSEWPSNLDIDQDLFDLYEQSMSDGPPGSILFVTDDYQSWRQVDDWPGGDDRVRAVIATPDGFLAERGRWGWGWELDGLYSSTEGITWEETELPADPGSIGWLGTHQERLLAVGGMWWGLDRVLWESDDGGTTWRAGAGFPADTWEIRVGGLGLVAWGEHWDIDEQTEEEPTVVESGEYTMTVGQEGLTISDADDAILLTANLWELGFGGPGELGLPEFIVADHQQQMFTILDPDTGETIMTVTYREMEDAFEAAQHRPEVGPATFVAYSADGKVWSEQAILEITGLTAWPDLVAVGDNLAVMTIYRLDNGRSLWRGTAVSPPEGTVSVTVSGVEDAEGWQLAGVLYDGVDMHDPDNRAIGGFAARVDSDPFSTTHLVRQPGDVGEGPFPYVGEDPLIVEPGTYTMMVWLGRELGPYSRWVPASSEGLVGCEALVEVKEGRAATVTVTGGFGDVSEGNPRCALGPDPGDATGSIELGVENLSGVEGYRLLAGVWSGFELVGGAFWILIDSDPFSGEDVVHPPFEGEDPPGVEYESWGEGDYLWSETAQLEPGTCEVTFWANPGELDPYGRHIPAGPIERSCWAEVEVRAGEVTRLVITDIPVGAGTCPIAAP